MNVRINLSGLKDENVKSNLQDKVRKVSADSESEFAKIHQVVESKIG
jgi:formiminotetrahydrofolate cyclodeaminase